MATTTIPLLRKIRTWNGESSTFPLIQRMSVAALMTATPARWSWNRHALTQLGNVTPSVAKSKTSSQHLQHVHATVRIVVTAITRQVRGISLRRASESDKIVITLPAMPVPTNEGMMMMLLTKTKTMTMKPRTRKGTHTKYVTATS